MKTQMTDTIVRFVRLFILSTLIVALAWMLLENEILGTVRSWTNDLLYAALIGVCIAMAQVVLDPRVRTDEHACPPCPQCEGPAGRAPELFSASLRRKGKAKSRPASRRAGKKKGRR